MVSDLLTYDKNKSMPTIRRSKDFRPSFGALKNLEAFVPSGAPMLATTATVTTAMRNDIIEKLDMAGCCVLTESPNKPNITYEAVRKNTIEEDVNCVVRDVAENNTKAQRVVVYCQSLDIYVCISVRTLSTSSRC